MGQSYVIIGNGIAGMAAAERIRDRIASARITVISAEPHGFYSRPGLAYVLNGTIPEKQLFPEAARVFKEKGIDTKHALVTGIRPHDHIVELKRGEKMQYDALLLAVGAKAVKPGIEGVQLHGVVTLDTLDDLRRILRLARRARRAVVIGGGITALELAEGLAARGVETHYFLRKDRYWRSVLDEDESRLVEARLKEERIHVHHNTEIQRITSKQGKVAGVATKDGRHFKCQIVAVAVGIRPRLALAAAAGLASDRGILVDERMQTSLSSIYAAGDAAQVYDPVSGEHKLDSLWWVARRQGEIAGDNMSGASETYRKRVAFNVTRIGGLTTTIIGSMGQAQADDDLIAIARGDSETWRHRPEAFIVEDASGLTRIRLLVGENRILGALIMGGQSLSHPLQDLVAEVVDISPIRASLLGDPTHLEERIIEFWREWRERHRALES